MPSLGLFPCSLDGCLLVEKVVWDSGNHRKLLQSFMLFAPVLQKCGLVPCVWALFLPNTAVLCCAELQSCGSAGRADSSVYWQDLYHSKGNVHYRGFSCHRPSPDLALVKLSWSSSRAQCVLTVMYGVEVVDSFLQLCNCSSHDD